MKWFLATNFILLTSAFITLAFTGDITTSLCVCCAVAISNCMGYVEGRTKGETK